MAEYKLKKQVIKDAMSETHPELFEKVWKKYRELLRGSIDSPNSDEDVIRWMVMLVGWEVNDARSRFFVTGRPR